MQVGGPQHESGFGNLAIKGIEEIVLPEPVSYFPQTVGWKVLGLMVFLYLLYRLLRYVKKWRRNRYRRAALKKLDQLRTDSSLSPADFLAEISVLLKATALHAFPREKVAGLYGDDWFRFLNQQAGMEVFDQASIGLLTVTAYQPSSRVTDSQVDHLIGQVGYWINIHPDMPHIRQGDDVLEKQGRIAGD